MTTGGTLYIVATPIGNLADISRRMEQVLADVDLVACEDTRHTRKLLSYLNIKTPLTSYYREKEQQKTENLLSKLKEGTDIALVSDAGTPGLSDPGAVLIRAARTAGIPVTPIPGPSALCTALSVAGLDDNVFFFGGFPPAKKGERTSFFSSLKTLTCPLVFYESPHRIKKTLLDCLEIFGNRDAQLFKELTKLHEQYYSGHLSELIEQTGSKIRGELVLVLNGCHDDRFERPEELEDLILWYRDKGDLSLKDTARIIASDLDLSRTAVYRQALSLWNRGKEKSL